MSEEKYTLDDENNILKGEMKITPSQAVSTMNLMGVTIKAKTQLCNNYEKKYHETKEKNRELLEDLQELKQIIREKPDFEEYLKGIQTTYDLIMSDYIDRLTAKEIEIFGLEMENDYLKEKLHEMKEDG